MMAAPWKSASGKAWLAWAGSSQGLRLTLGAPLDWPPWLRHLALVMVFVLTLLLLWFGWLETLSQEFRRAQIAQAQTQTELRARGESLRPLPALKAHQAQTQQALEQLEKQLPGPSELNALMSGLSRLATVKRLQLELIKPQVLIAGPLYAEQRVALQLTGRFDALTGFMTELPALPWPVVLHSFTLAPAEADLLRMEMVLRSLRAPGSSVSAVSPGRRAQAPEPEPIMGRSAVTGLAGLPAGLAPFSGERLWPVAPVLAAPVAARVEAGRFKPPLQAAPLAAMSMVGSVLGAQAPVALLRVNARIYLVRVGDRLGVGQAQVTDITQSGLSLREFSADPQGKVVEKTVRLNLVQEPQ